MRPETWENEKRSKGGYGYNHSGCGYQFDRHDDPNTTGKANYLPAYVKINHIRVPAETVIICDSSDMSNAQQNNTAYYKGYGPGVGDRHGESLNVLWCDGHASNERTAKMEGGKTTDLWDGSPERYYYVGVFDK